MSAQTARQRRILARLAAAPTPEQRAALARDFARRHPTNASARYELDRAARIDAQLQADALLQRVRAAGEVGCAEPAEPSLTLAEVVRINAVGLAVIAALLVVGYLTAPLLVRVLAALREVLA